MKQKFIPQHKCVEYILLPTQGLGKILNDDAQIGGSGVHSFVTVWIE